MTDERLRDVLHNWASWSRRSDLRLGYRPRAFGVVGNASTDFQELCESADDREAAIVDTVVSDLPARERDAVHNVVLGTRRPLGEPLQDVYARARGMLVVELNRRGVE